MATEEYLQIVRAEIARLAQQDGSDRLAATVTRMLAPHTEFGIYGECEHNHEQIGWNGPRPVYEPGVVLVDEIGPTSNHEFSTCTQCCTDQIHGGDEIQREDCANANVDDVFWHSCWPCQAWLDAGDGLGIPRPESLAANLTAP